MSTKTEELNPANPEVAEIFQLLDAHNLSLCDPSICNLTQPDELASIASALIGIRSDGRLVSVGGLKFFEGYAEVTRMILPSLAENTLRHFSLE